MKRRRSICILANIYIGTIIGAGFASGQEILQFFCKYGKFGILGIVFSTTLLGFTTFKVLKSVYYKKIYSFEEFLVYYFPKKSCGLINLMLAFFLIAMYIVMLAGSGAVVEEHFQISAIYGILLMSFLNFIVFIFGMKGITKANSFIVPLMIVVIFFVTFFVIKENGFLFSSLHTKTFLNLPEIKVMGIEVSRKEIFLVKLGWIWSAVVYASYNSITLIVIITSLLPFIYDEKAAKKGIILGSVGLCFMALLILTSLLTLYTDILGLEIPMIAVAHSLGNIHKQIYSIILILAMFTTSIANGYGSIQRFSFITGIKKKWITIFICIIAIPLATLGFKNLVMLFYPLFGYIGFLFIGAILLKGGR
ncbi:hypothetical protein [Clostridium formicaceticum]|uniref:Uncharacterized protein n=1 Tax=Clostridium formicaceticum TaxID=1497 RepID=A0AAC9RU57_9CLOT|nr:hypothetical protein [Clostridium formicaceticum]AOY75400.1 hypothetical protein BJL90_05475 [Clostridium formicaceticum]ARE89855.1 hypothetical protein CLFO_43380 [Clostridium formicaceticum]